MKRILFLLSLLQITLMVSAYDIKVDGIYYNFTSNSTVAVTYNDIDSYHYSGIGFGLNHPNEEYKGNMVIPASIEYKNKTYAVTSIGKAAFSVCPLLKSVTLPTSIVTIEDGAFNNSGLLESVEIPEGVKEVGAAFSLCANLKTIVLPSTVTKVHLLMINSSNKMEELICKATTPPTFYLDDDDGSTLRKALKERFFGKCVLKVPQSSIKAYKSTPGWDMFCDICSYTPD